MFKVFLQNSERHTHILHSISVFLLVEVVVKCSHVRLFEIGLERQKIEKPIRVFKQLRMIPVRQDKTLTDLDLARLPSVWMVLEIRVSVREVAGSWRNKVTWRDPPTSFMANTVQSGNSHLKCYLQQIQSTRLEPRLRLYHSPQLVSSENTCFPWKAGLTGWCGRRWNKFGERMAGAKKRRKMKLLTAV